MATGTVLAVAQTLFAAIQCNELRHIFTVLGYKDDVEKLANTASAITAALLEADSKHSPSPGEQDWVEKLKDAVYEVDDLLDEFNTIVQRNQLLDDRNKGDKMLKKISNKVSRFFSRSNALLVAFNTSHDVKRITERLDAIASDRSRFSLGSNYEPIRRPRKGTFSHVDHNRIIGRENDKKGVVDLLLQDHPSENVSFVSIEGLGGLGKTALAQIVYDDDRITNEFELRLWVCVSDEFQVEGILTKMLMSVTDEKCVDLGKEQLVRKIKEKIQGRRYLLVLDDVWCESPTEWVDLKDFLIIGGRGSRVLVTTRNRSVTRAIGDHPVYGLKGLSDDDSWHLFAQMAFDYSHEQADAHTVEIGHKIVKRCSNVPLSLRVVGSLLRCVDWGKWESFEQIDLSNLQHGKDNIMDILQISYNNLTFHLKSCFSYCALFPKDYIIKKSRLINLWLAHGCVETEVGKRIEAVAEDYFDILVNRCFFQEVKVDEIDYFDDKCKMHDLVHDLARKVAGNELLSTPGSHINGKFRHLSLICEYSCLKDGTHKSVGRAEVLRTFLHLPKIDIWWQYRGCRGLDAALTIVLNCRKLRVLDLSRSCFKNLPNTIGELVHLRCLDLSHNTSLKMLPKSITKLHNLQVLELRRCFDLKVLPKDLSKLGNLRVLDLEYCHSLTHMPAGIDKMTCLHRLTMFVVGRTCSKGIKVSHLCDLEALVNLSSTLKIELGVYFGKDASTLTEGRYPLTKSCLKSLNINFKKKLFLNDNIGEAVLEALKPNPCLKRLEICMYKGEKFPRWESMKNSLATSLPHLVDLKLESLPRVRYLPSMRGLLHLKYLKLDKIPNVEFIEEDEHNIAVPSSYAVDEDKECTFFPHLEKLSLCSMDKLKGWLRAREDVVTTIGNGNDDGTHDPVSSLQWSFSCLRRLEIEMCPSLTSLPSGPSIEKIELREVNEELSFGEMRSCTVKFLRTDKFGEYKNCIPHLIQGIAELEIRWYEKESLSTVETIKCLQSCTSSLQTLTISWSGKLKRVGRGVFENLTNLRSLRIYECSIYEEKDEDEDDDGISWKSLENLSLLSLSCINKMVSLPKGIQYLTALQSLKMYGCFDLERIPEWIGCLVSLRRLEIEACHHLESLPEAIAHMRSLTQLIIKACSNKLKERCKGPNGEYWPNIRHIPHLQLLDDDYF